MEDALSRIAALAPTLKEAELRCLLELTRRRSGDATQASSRELARATATSRNHVQAAIHSLTERGIIGSDGGTATKAANYRLQFLNTAVLPAPEVPPERGCFREPPLAPQGSLPLAAFGSHPGCEAEPPTGYLKQPHPRARVAPGSESDSDWNNRIRATSDLLERIAKAKPEAYDSDEIRTVRDALCGYWRRMREEPDAHPPPDKLCAEMLAIAPRRRILQLIDELWRNRQKPDRSYRWFVTVALNRIHHLEPAHIGKGFAQLRTLEKHVPNPEQRALLSEDDKERMLALHEAVKRAAAGKAFR